MTKKTIVPIHNAPQRFTKYSVKQKKILKNIIYMGSFMPYKNVETLIKGMEWLPGKTLHLLSKISAKRKAELEKLIPKNAEVIFHNGVTDDKYEALLADNALLATASLDEGYGIPVAEAMAMKVPVVVSDIPVFHEVGADGALYFNPRSPKDFAKKVVLLDDAKTRSECIKKGSQHIDGFSWDISARILLDTITAAR